MSCNNFLEASEIWQDIVGGRRGEHGGGSGVSGGGGGGGRGPRALGRSRVINHSRSSGDSLRAMNVTILRLRIDKWSLVAPCALWEMQG